MGRVRVGVTVGAAVCVLAVTGCGGGSSGDSEASLMDYRQSPLAKLLGFDISTAEQREQSLKMEQLTAECMKQEGWEYKPATTPPSMNAFSDEYEEQLADPVAYGEKYGYGVVRGYELQEQTNGDGGEQYTDPNADYVSSLSEDESTAYYEALYGKQSSEPMGEDEEYVPPPVEEQGCYGKANAEVSGGVFSNPDLMKRLNDSFDQTTTDPEYKAAIKAWVTCMGEADSSYEWATPEDVSSELYNRLSEAQGYPVTVDEEGNTFSESISEEDGPPVVDEAAIEQLREDEIRIWADDHRCQVDAKILQVQRDIEQRIADDIAADFPELVKQP